MPRRRTEDRLEKICEAARLLALVERCAADWPELCDVYFVRDRRRFHRRVSEHLEQRAATEQLEPIADVDVATRFLVQSVSWMAWKRTHDIDADTIDEEAVRETFRELLVTAFAAS